MLVSSATWMGPPYGYGGAARLRSKDYGIANYDGNALQLGDVVLRLFIYGIFTYFHDSSYPVLCRRRVRVVA